jgi:hypothetical protein
MIAVAMIVKTVAILCALALPVSFAYWYKSHKHPAQHRYDITAYKSMNVYLREGVCGLHIASMPSKVASRTEFHATLSHVDLLRGRTLGFSTTRKGPYRFTWIIFPLWLPTLALIGTGVAALFVGPIRKMYRARIGCCTECGYSLQGNKSGRCPECGTPRGSSRASSSKGKRTAATARGPKRYRL